MPRLDNSNKLVQGYFDIQAHTPGETAPIDLCNWHAGRVARRLKVNVEDISCDHPRYAETEQPYLCCLCGVELDERDD